MSDRRNVPLILGCVLWLGAIAGIGGSAYTICHRMLRSMSELCIPAPNGHGLSPGDTVFLSTEDGLQRVGEVHSIHRDIITLSIDQKLGDLSDSRATCWRTPLSAEETVSAIFPIAIRKRVDEQVALAWHDHGGELTEIWKPIAADLFVAYIKLIVEELEAAIQNHNGDMQTIGQEHLRRLGDDWPVIQQRLRPILREHLAPTLSRLAGGALADAPKTQIAWNIVRGNYDAAYGLMLDWLGAWIADMPKDDRHELHEALYKAWDAAQQDEELKTRMKVVFQRIRNDDQVQQLLTDIYHETMTKNSRTASFLRARLVDDPHVRQETYRTLELLGPALKNILAATLFDRSGSTRPEIVHLVRSVALRRKMAWVTLHTKEKE